MRHLALLINLIVLILGMKLAKLWDLRGLSLNGLRIDTENSVFNTIVQSVLDRLIHALSLASSKRVDFASLEAKSISMASKLL